MQALYAPGARVVIRDCEWIAKRADRSDDGLSELLNGTTRETIGALPQHFFANLTLKW